ncbi:MAG: DDE-type integrase/transposase/recombinase [SAR324 cluster bacterium]|nr:DDE-type integrase/transposase/recombinase [SAR324 cluster bacterium]
MESDERKVPTTGEPIWKRAPGQRYYTAEQRRALVAAYHAWDRGLEAFCQEHEVTATSLYAWLRAFKAGGAEALAAHVRGRPARKVRRGQYSPEQRRQAVEQHLKQGGGAAAFAQVWGITPRILRIWVARYRTGGPQALEGRPGRKPGRAPMPAGVTAAILETKTAFPTFGLRKVRDFLMRFKQVKASTPVIRRVVAEAQLPPAPVPKRRWKKHPAPRFFERARPGELWQTDLTSFVLPRHGLRVYLVVFLDDHSRYIVSWKTGLRQTGDLVCEALLEGIQRWGKPKEILSDQGRQYFSWRGKSDFQKRLAKQGIQHVVARTHHPETLGKCERLWATIGSELMSRVVPQDLSDFQARLAHFFAHYNHFRPHQGIGGSVPADRFFGAEVAVRKAIEAQISKQALALALGEVPRPGAYLVGQIGDQAISVHGEAGKLVVQLPDGRRTELAYDSLGMAPSPLQPKEGTDERRNDRSGERDRSDGGDHGDRALQPGDGQASAEAEPAQASVCDATAGLASEGAVGSGERGGACGRAPDGDATVRALAGADQPDGAGGEDRAAAGQGVAALAAGVGGTGGGAAQAAGEAAEGDAAPAAAPDGGGSPAAAQSAGGSGAQERDSGRLGAGAAGVSEPAAGAAGSGNAGGATETAGPAEGEKKSAGPGDSSAGGSERAGDASSELTGAGSAGSSG